MKYRGRMVLLFMSLLTSFIFLEIGGVLSPVFLIFASLHAIISWVFGSWYDKNKYLSYHDPLTGVFNRRYAYLYFEKKLRCVRQRNESLGIITMDIDNFKEINDTYGHDYGDFILKELTRLVDKSIRKEDVFVRWGGDEFLLILVNRDKAETDIYIKELHETIKTTCSLHPEGKKVLISISIGYSLFPVDAKELSQLITIADKRMYQVKHGYKSS